MSFWAEQGNAGRAEAQLQLEARGQSRKKIVETCWEVSRASRVQEAEKYLDVRPVQGMKNSGLLFSAKG